MTFISFSETDLGLLPFKGQQNQAESSGGKGVSGDTYWYSFWPESSISLK